MGELTVFVCTLDSSATIERCLAGLEKSTVEFEVVVIDHYSTDGTVEIARRYGTKVVYERIGLGHARQLALDMVKTRLIAFVDSDVEVREPLFFQKAIAELEDPRVGAVAGMAVGHKLTYGLPAGLLVLRANDFRGRVIPDYINARETYYLQKRLDELGLSTAYLADAMLHDSRFREFKPEWEGANTRIASGIRPKELVFALKVILMMSFNSRSIKNFAYVPLFYLKFLRGFADPGAWRKLRRSV